MKRDVRDPESIADHMYRMGLMALIASDIPGVDRDKLSFAITSISIFMGLGSWCFLRFGFT